MKSPKTSYLLVFSSALIAAFLPSGFAHASAYVSLERSAKGLISMQTAQSVNLYRILIYFSIAFIFLISVLIVILYLLYKNKRIMLKSVIYDKLTGLYVKEGFYIEVKNIIKNSSDLYVIIYINIVQFKVVNEYFGFKTGDNVLKYCAALLEDGFGKAAVIARAENDRFLVCMPYSKLDLTQIDIFEEKLGAYVKGIKLATKTGIYIIENRNQAVSAMCDCALMAMKNAQKLQNKKYCFYDERIKLKFLEEQKVLANFEDALKNRQFVVYYQPIISLNEKKVFCAEALVRWVHPLKGIIYPSDFIPALENNGMISELDFYVWEEVFKYARSRMDRNRAPMFFSINLSRVQLYSTKFVDVLTNLSVKYNVPPEMIRVEITETAYIQDMRYFTERLLMLRRKGFKIVMDDFGNGYSSLNVLGELPLDIVKLDVSFFAAKQKSRANSIVMSIIQMLHNIGISVVAEGVETREQTELLYTLGCDSIQGFYFYKPMAVEDFEREDNTAIETGSREIMKNRDKVQMNIHQLKSIENFKGMDTIVEAIPCGFGVFSASKTVVRAVFLSEGIEAFLGYENGEGYKMSRDNISEIIHPDDLNNVVNGVQKALENQMFFEEEFRMKTSRGDFKWVSFRANVVEEEEDYSTWYGVYTNIDGYHKANDELKRINEFYKDIYDTTCCGIILFSADGNYIIKSANKTACGIFGYGSEKECMEKLKIMESILDEDRENFLKKIKCAEKKTTPVLCEIRFKKRSGGTVCLKGSLQCKKTEGRKYFQSSFIDITQSEDTSK